MRSARRTWKVRTSKVQLPTSNFEVQHSQADLSPSLKVGRWTLDVGRSSLSHSKPLKRFGGFSLVEIMIVVVIIGLMAGLVTYATAGIMERAKRTRARSDIATFSGAVDSYYLAKGSYPGNDLGLKALVPEFIKVLQKDPWGNPYLYVQPGKNGAYDIVSYGADGREGGTGSDADITNSDPEVIEARHK